MNTANPPQAITKDREPCSSSQPLGRPTHTLAKLDCKAASFERKSEC